MILLLMGVSGAGKTTIGRLLSKTLHWPFFEGDDFHPPANIAKMDRGIPLTDADREPWLAALKVRMDRLRRQGTSAVITCSALKSSYRKLLREDAPEMQFIYLKGDFALLRDRLAARPDHFMGPELLASQFAALEEPEEALVVPAAWKPEEIVQFIRRELNPLTVSPPNVRVPPCLLPDP